MLKSRLPDMDYRYLPLDDKSEGAFFHAPAPRHECDAENRVVSPASHQAVAHA